MIHRITLIPGDGIGPEVAAAARECVEATGVKIEWDVQVAGQEAVAKFGSPLPEPVLESIRRNKTALKGPITTPIGTGIKSVNVGMRQALDLYASVRPCRLYSGVLSRYDDVNLVLIRENTEDLYAGIEYSEGSPEARELIEWVRLHGGKSIRPDSAVSLKPISTVGSERIARFAFEYALQHGRKRVTAVHKANIMKSSDGLFLKVFRTVAQEYAGRVAADDQLIDSLCMRLVQEPLDYDVLVLPNLYGDIVSDLCAGFIGGLGLAPGVNLGKEYAIFEPVHGSAPALAGQNKANPIATILSAVLLLRHINEPEAASRLEWAVAEILRERRYFTEDLKTDDAVDCAIGTAEIARAIIRKLESGSQFKSVPSHNRM